MKKATSNATMTMPWALDETLFFMLKSVRVKM